MIHKNRTGFVCNEKKNSTYISKPFKFSLNKTSNSCILSISFISSVYVMYSMRLLSKFCIKSTCCKLQATRHRRKLYTATVTQHINLMRKRKFKFYYY